MAETIKTQTTGYECVGIEKIEQTYEGLYDNKPNIITIYLTNGDTHQFKVMNGSQGVGIDRIEQRQSSTVSGGRNEFAIILTNGKEYTFSTYNGSGGSGSSGSFNQVLQHLNNMLMPSGKSYLYYNGSGFEWKSPDGSTGGSGSGSSTSTSVSWANVTNKPSTFTPSSHTHPTSEISGLSSYVQGIKVNYATNADKATQLANARTIWGQSFNGTDNITGNLKMGSAGGGSIQLWMNGGNILDRTDNTLHIGYGLKESSDGEINLDAYVTRVYTDNLSRHYDFKSNVFDVNTNAIHFGSGASGGKISWDAANNAFKIEGNFYATGGITALCVSNSATTSNNVDFTFKSVTANTFNVKDSIQLSDGLILKRNASDFDLISTNGTVNSFYLDGTTETYYLTSNGDGYFSRLACDILNISNVEDFKVVDINDKDFTIQFKYNGKTYSFTPSIVGIS